MRKRFVKDIDECKKLWKTLIRPRTVSDLWEFRLCFHHHFNRQPWFLVLEDRDGICAMLPLSLARELDMFVFFPGEIWKSRTWNERNPIYLRDPEFLPELYSACPERTYLRYLEHPGACLDPDLEEDETGYVLYPPHLGYDLDYYIGRFARKKFKEIRKVINALLGVDGAFHLNRLEDFDALVEMSLRHFGSDSYLYDERFRESFRDVMGYLDRRGRLRMVSLEIHGEISAVDLGGLYQGGYTVFLGGTDPRLPGIAKAMNMHHIQFAFSERLSKVDFLCGDFHWKKLWHLDPEPLYRFVSPDLRLESPLEGEVLNPDAHPSHEEGSLMGTGHGVNASYVA